MKPNGSKLTEELDEVMEDTLEIVEFNACNVKEWFIFLNRMVWIYILQTPKRSLVMQNYESFVKGNNCEVRAECIQTINGFNCECSDLEMARGLNCTCA